MPQQQISTNFKSPMKAGTKIERKIGFFREIDADELQKIKKSKKILSHSFFLKQSFPNKILFLLTKEFLILKPENSEDFFVANLSYDLKFRFLKNDPELKMHGLQIFDEFSNTFQNFYSQNVKMIQSFGKYLLRKINHLGFHHLFKAVRKLGKGNFATVFQVERNQDGKRFAAKAFSKNQINSADKGLDCLKHEIAVLREVNDQNLPQFQGVYESQNSLYIVLELLTKGTIGCLNNPNPSKVKEIMKGIFSGLSHLHEKNLVHRDLKLQNIMMKSDNTPVIIDFGLSTFVHKDTHIYTKCGTPGYLSPEIVFLNAENPQFYTQSDIFSVGVIFHYLITGMPLFNGETASEVYERNKKFDIDFDAIKNYFTTEEFDLFQKMLKMNPQQRITADEALKHEYFESKTLVSPTLTNEECIGKEMEFLELE